MLLADSRGRACECTIAFNRDGTAYLESGIYFDNETEVPNDELEWMQDNYVDKLEEQAFERVISRADWMLDEMRDRE